MSEPLILKIKNKSKIVASSTVRQPIANASQAKVTFSEADFSGEIQNLTFSNNEITIGKGVKKISVKAKVYANLIKVGAYVDIRIVKNNNDNTIGTGIEYGSQGNETATIRAEAEIVEVEEGDKIYIIAYNSHQTINIALDSLIKRSLIVEVLE